jgi:hypothetical protein
MATGASLLVGLRMREWGMDEQPSCLRASVRKVLNELAAEALSRLKDPRFEVIVRPEPGFSVWAYFPVHRRRLIARQLRPRRQTRVLLVFSLGGLEQETAQSFEECLRDHLGHALLYMRDPKAWNDCDAAWKEWCSSLPRQRPARERSKEVAVGRE